MGDRDWISRVAAALAALFILAGYAIPWFHVDIPPCQVFMVHIVDE